MTNRGVSSPSGAEGRHRARKGSAQTGVDTRPLATAVLPVYLIHWNAPDWCLSSIRSIRASSLRSIAITVIDNGQLEGRPLADLLPAGIRIVQAGENRGYTGGANLALDDWKQTFPDSRFAVIGSHDLHVASDCLARLVTAAAREDAYGILGPVLTGPMRQSGGAWDSRGTRTFPLESRDGVLERDWMNGTCLLIRRTCADEIWGFDEAFGSYFEEVDFCLRAWDAGWKVGVVSKARAHGLGTISKEAPIMMASNLILLRAKRDGLPGAARAIWRHLSSIIRSSFGSVALWRDREARTRSALNLQKHLKVLSRHDAKTLIFSVGRRSLVRRRTAPPPMGRMKEIP